MPDNEESELLMELWYGNMKVKGKVNQSHYTPGQALIVPEVSGSQISRQPAHEGGKVVSPMHRPPLPPMKYSWYSFLLEAECGRKDYVNEKANETIGDRNRDLPVCSAVPRPTAPPRTLEGKRQLGIF
jgi:hypothetical protein